MLKRILYTSSAAMLSVAIGSSAAYAQTSGFDEIIVTAQKIEQSLQDVPVSVMAVSGDELVERNINEITQLTLAAPTLQTGQDNAFSIRGIGTQISVETVDPSVALAVDGVSLGRNVMAGQPFNDVASVEVLNGPQGLLFGKNASAGLINVTTKRPVLGEFEGSAGFEYLVRDTTPTNANGKVARGTLNIPVSENSALRINALYSDQESIVENIFPNPDTIRVDLDKERWGIKAKYLYENGPLSAYLIADYNENSGAGGRLSRTFRASEPGDGVFPSFERDGITPGPENLTNASDGQMFRDVEVGGAQATIEYELGNGMEIVNIAAWRYYESDQNIHSDFTSYRDIIDNPTSNDYTQISNELRLVLPKSDKLNGQVGLFYFESDSNIIDSLKVQGPLPDGPNAGFPFCVNAEVVPGPPPNCSVSNVSFLGTDADTQLDATSYAAYGQFDYNVTDRFTATAGARLTVDEVSSTVVQSLRDYFVNIGGPRGTFSETVENTNLSWKFGAQYELSDNAMIYASAGQGYKAPGFNTDFLNIPEVPFAVQDEVSTTFEAGIKSKLFDDRVILNVSLFNTDFEDYQEQSFDQTIRGFIIQNSASVQSRGAEVSLGAKLSENFTLYWDAAILDSTFDEFTEATCTPDNSSQECVTNGFFDASGLPTPISADFTSTLQAMYENDITDSMDVFVQGSMYTRSEINFGTGSPTQKLGALSTFNLSAGLKMDNGISFSIFCKNCTDEKVPTSIAFDPGSSNRGVTNVNQTWGLDSVRAIGATTSVDF